MGIKIIKRWPEKITPHQKVPLIFQTSASAMIDWWLVLCCCFSLRIWKKCPQCVGFVMYICWKIVFFRWKNECLKRLWNEAGVSFHSRQVKEWGSFMRNLVSSHVFLVKMIFEYHVKISGNLWWKIFIFPTCTTSWKIFWSHESSQQNARANLAAWNVFQIHSWSETNFFIFCFVANSKGFFLLEVFWEKK